MPTSPRCNIALIICAVLLVAACKTDQTPAFPDKELDEAQDQVNTASVKNEEERPFAVYYQQLVMALVSGDASSSNGLVHPVFGCYLIEAPGAIPVFTPIVSLEQVVRNGAKRSSMASNQGLLAFSLTEDSLPTIDCDATEGFYTKEGAYVQDINVLAQEKIWQYIGLDTADQKPINELARTVTKTIVNTAGFSAYFSKIGDEWYVTFLDIRVPCSA